MKKILFRLASLLLAVSGLSAHAGQCPNVSPGEYRATGPVVRNIEIIQPSATSMDDIPIAFQAWYFFKKRLQVSVANGSDPKINCSWTVLAYGQCKDQPLLRLQGLPVSGVNESDYMPIYDGAFFQQADRQIRISCTDDTIEFTEDGHSAPEHDWTGEGYQYSLQTKFKILGTNQVTFERNGKMYSRDGYGQLSITSSGTESLNLVKDSK